MLDTVIIGVDNLYLFDDIMICCLWLQWDPPWSGTWPVSISMYIHVYVLAHLAHLFNYIPMTSDKYSWCYTANSIFFLSIIMVGELLFDFHVPMFGRSQLPLLFNNTECSINYSTHRRTIEVSLWSQPRDCREPPVMKSVYLLSNKQAVTRFRGFSLASLNICS